MIITVLIEGKTEQAFKPYLLEFLKRRLDRRMPKLDFFPCQGRVYKEHKLRRAVENLLRNGPVPRDAVIALTDVYTGTQHSTISKPGCCRSGAIFKCWRVITKSRLPGRLRP